MRHPILLLPVLAYIGWGAWNWATNRPMHPADGVLAADDPQQIEVRGAPRLRLGRWILTVRADYLVTARILGRERYHFDAISDLAPVDLALGWGPMSDNRVLRGMQISQSNRFFFWRAPVSLPIDRTAVIRHSANTHIIPGDASVASELSRLRPGQVVTLAGELVDGVRDDGVRISTSLSRDDMGAGACEVLLVSQVRT